jgi:hypothetical protein
MIIITCTMASNVCCAGSRHGASADSSASRVGGMPGGGVASGLGILGGSPGGEGVASMTMKLG